MGAWRFLALYCVSTSRCCGKVKGRRVALNGPIWNLYLLFFSPWGGLWHTSQMHGEQLSSVLLICAKKRDNDGMSRVCMGVVGSAQRDRYICEQLRTEDHLVSVCVWQQWGKKMANISRLALFGRIPRVIHGGERWEATVELKNKVYVETQHSILQGSSPF